MPKQATAALQTYLNTKNDVVVADLYTFAYVGGLISRFIDYPLASVNIPAVNFPGSPLNYSASGNRTFLRGPGFGRSKITTKIGVEPSDLEIEMFPGPINMLGVLSLAEFAEAEGFDAAYVELNRFFMPVGGDGLSSALDTSLGAIVWFYGRMAEVEVSRSSIKLKVKSLINILQQQQLPRRLFQSGCTHIFGDAMCGYDRVAGKNALGTSTGVGALNETALGGSNTIKIVISGTPSVNYIQGTAKSTSGSNSGISRGVLNVGAGSIDLTRPFPFSIQAGDTFQVLPGCDHTSSYCNNTLQNLLRYGGFDYIPPPEFAV